MYRPNASGDHKIGSHPLQGHYRFSGDGGAATQASLNNPYGVAVDAKGNVYIADRDNHRIRRVGPDGIITTVAGSGATGFREAGFSGDGGPATQARLNFPGGVAVDEKGNLYIADTNNYRIRRVGPEGIITTLAGTGKGGFSGDGGPAAQASLDSPIGVAVDAAGSVYIADAGNDRIRRVSPDGIITTIAGGGSFLGDGGPAIQAILDGPIGVAVDAKGDVYIADKVNHRVRRVGSDGVITTFAGTGPTGYGKGGFSGDGGPAVQAQLNFPSGIAVDAKGNVYIADTGNHRIRLVGPDGIITTFAGTGKTDFSGDGGPATQASLKNPYGVAVDAKGVVYIADSNNQRIRRVGLDGIITTFAGGGGPLGDGRPATQVAIRPTGVAIDAKGNVYIADIDNNRIHRVGADSIITTVAGSGPGAFQLPSDVPEPVGPEPDRGGFSGDGGPATQARLNSPYGVAVDVKGNIYIADLYNHRIRRVEGGGVSGPSIRLSASSLTFDSTRTGGTSQKTFTISNTDTVNLSIAGIAVVGKDSSQFKVPPTTATIAAGQSLTVKVTFAPTSAGLKTASLSVAHSGAGSPATVALNGTGIGTSVTQEGPGIITTFAGTGTRGFSGDGGPATRASLSFDGGLGFSQGIFVDRSGNLYIPDTNNHRVRKVDPSGTITTVVGNALEGGFSGDGGPATAASLKGPISVFGDRSGNLYIADMFNNRIRKVDASGVITTAAGSGIKGFSGDGGPATRASLWVPSDVFGDASGNLYIADRLNQRIRKVDASGMITTVAGNGPEGFSGDGGPAIHASLNRPVGVSADGSGHLYIADTFNHRVRKVDASGIITTVAGNGLEGFSGDGGPAIRASLNHPVDVFGDISGNLYIADQRNHRIRKVDASVTITTVAGDGSLFFSGDGGPATRAGVGNPNGVFVDEAGNLYIADNFNLRIRRVVTPRVGDGTGGLGVGDQKTRTQGGVKPGQKVDILIAFDQEITGATGFQVVLTFDPKKLSVVSGKGDGVFAIAVFPGPPLVRDSTVTYAGAFLGQTTTARGPVAVLTFQASGDFSGETEVVLTRLSIRVSGSNKEFTPQASVVLSSAGASSPDFDGDGEVGFADFFLFAEAFGKKAAGGDAKFDLDWDGAVGFGDFFAFAAEFGKKLR